MQEENFTAEPVVSRLHYGGWMATTGPETNIRIGVIGADEQEVRAQFRASMNRWKELSEIEEGKG
jgi:hypothetical protein